MASPIAHTLIGAAIYASSRRGTSAAPAETRPHLPGEAGRASGARSGLLRHPRLGLAGAVFLANLMDADFLVGFLLGSPYHHRHVHTAGFALAVSALIALGARILGLSWRRASVLALALLGSHLLLDSFTADTSPPFGSMLLWPLSDRYFLSPVPLFLDVWRGTAALLLGPHNLAGALRELAVGSGCLALVGIWRRSPRRWMALWAGGALASLLAALLLGGALEEAGARQMRAYLAERPTDASGRGEDTAGPLRAQPGRTGTAEGWVRRGILFASPRREGQWDIFRIRPDGTGLTRLTDDPADDSMPRWSPDGRWIAFQSNRSGTWDIFVMRPDGTDVRPVAAGPGDQECPTWLPGGARIAYSSEGTGDAGEDGIYSSPVQGGEPPRAITLSGEERAILPACSPRDPWLAFTSRGPNLPFWHIYRCDLEGRERQRISSRSGCRAKWSPDGRYLAYVEGAGLGASEIAVFRADGSEHRRVTSTPEYDYDPTWSPDGREICYARGQEGKGGWDLWIVGLDGQGLRPVTRQDAGDRFPSWR